jgi:hypothetical protein
LWIAWKGGSTARTLPKYREVTSLPRHGRARGTMIVKNMLFGNLNSGTRGVQLGLGAG